MAEEELIPVTVWLAGRSYRLRIKPQEEESVRRAIKQADERVMEMRSHYAGKDDQDFLAMCLLTYAADIATGDLSSSTVPDAEINALTAKIDKALKAS